MISAAEKASLGQWKRKLEMISDTEMPFSDETETQRRERLVRLEADTEAWFKYYFPKFTYARAAPFHLAATRRILVHPEWFEVRLWSRELAKSTRTMMEVLYLCLTGRKKYVLLISNSLDNAVRLLEPYKLNLESNRRLISDYGEQENPGNWTMAEFTTFSGVAFRALGAGQSPRGTRNGETRPDVIIFDDLDTDEDCLNLDIVAKKWRWVEEAAIGTRSVSTPTLILFCGNRIARDCCVERAVKFADYADEVNIRDKNGVSSWAEKNSEDDIERVLAQKSYAAVQKEYFNNPVNEGAVFKTMAYKPACKMEDYRLLVCYTDPSYKDTNDYKATVLVGMWQGEFHVIRCFLQQTTSANMIDWHYMVMDMVGACSCHYYMESGFMQDVLIREINEAAKKRGRIIPLMGDTRKKKDKFTRIECLLEPLNRNGNLFLNEAFRNDPNMMRLAEQFTAFSPGSRAHDDGPDAVEGAVWILNQKAGRTMNEEIVCFTKTRGLERF